jgi:hypothetical protein
VQRVILKRRGELTGHEFESAIVAEMYKQVRAMDLDCQFYHLRSLDGRETDLLIETESGYFAFEIKMSGYAHPADARHFKGLSAILDKPLLHGFVLSNDPSVKQPDPGVTFVSAAMFLS